MDVVEGEGLLADRDVVGEGCVEDVVGGGFDADLDLNPAFN